MQEHLAPGRRAVLAVLSLLGALLDGDHTVVVGVLVLHLAAVTLLHGPGKITADGAVYEGEFQHGKLHGQGKITDADGSVREGEFQNGKLHGPGKITYTDGDVYEGEYQAGALHGQGKVTDADGNVVEGEFQHGSASWRSIAIMD